MKFNALASVSSKFYQKRLFIFLTKQFENSSLINASQRFSSPLLVLPPPPPRDQIWVAEIDGFSFILEISE